MNFLVLPIIFLYFKELPLASYQIVVSFIAGTKTKKGLKVACEIDDTEYETGIEITDEKFATINMSKRISW